MAKRGGLGSVGTPESVFIQPDELPKKEPHHCQFDDCTKPRRGYHKFCREHKVIGRIISGKIAREKAIAKIAERDGLDQITETNPSHSSSKTNNSSSNYIDQAQDNTFFFGAAIFFILLTTLLVDGPSSAKSEEIYYAACLALPICCTMIASAIKEPLTKIIVMSFLIPITIFLMISLFFTALFASAGGGGCYGVCGLSGWGGP